jgi:hypothetical protein
VLVDPEQRQTRDITACKNIMALGLVTNVDYLAEATLVFNEVGIGHATHEEYR